MSSTPSLRPQQRTPVGSPPVSYNNVETSERINGAPSVTEIWKQWQGQVVDHQFVLQQYLGGSDHSAVFLTQREGRLKAAIKLIPAANPEAADRQLFQWRLATKLPHTHLIRIFQTGRCELGDQSLLYIVMEYAEEDLSQIIPQRPLTASETRDMLRPVLDALAYVHGKGFVHGHLKPANIMAIADQVKLSSDGLCAPGESNGLRGTSYSAPEAASGAVSPPADIWSLGVTLVEALTLHQPTWDAAKPMEPVLPKELPAPFAEIARHCLRPDSRQRWTVAQIAANLETGFRALQKSVTGGPAISESTSTEKKPLAKWLYAVPVAACIALAVLTGSRMRQSRPQVQQVEARHPQVQAEPVHSSQAQHASVQQSGVAPRKAQPEKSKQIATSNLEAPIQPAVKPTPATPVTRPSTTRANEAPFDDARASTASTVTPRSETSSGATSGSTAATATSSTSSAFPGVIHQVMPEVSPSARNTIQGHVRVTIRVAVDASGDVTSATFDSPGPSKYFAGKAMEAAQGWKFSPAEANGQAIPSQWILRFAFGKAGTEVSPVQTAPKPTR